MQNERMGDGREPHLRQTYLAEADMTINPDNLGLFKKRYLLFT